MRSGRWTGRGVVVAAVVACASAGASAEIRRMVWYEVDNAATTLVGAEGIPTNLEGYRTFDLYAICSPDTRLIVADFGIVGAYHGGRSFWTTQEVLKVLDNAAKPTGIHPRLVELIPQMEFDTTVTMGEWGGWIVLTGDGIADSFHPRGFMLAWMAPFSRVNGRDQVAQVRPVEGHILLARVTVTSSGEFGEDTSDTEFLGGTIFLAGQDAGGHFGGEDPSTGLFYVPNAFGARTHVSGAPPVRAPRRPDGSSASGVTWPPAEGQRPPSVLDMDFNGVVDARDVAYAVGRLGSRDETADIDGDGKVSALDIAIMVRRFAQQGRPLGDMPEEVVDEREQQVLTKAVRKAVRIEHRQTRNEAREEKGRQKKFLKLMKKWGVI